MAKPYSDDLRQKVIQAIELDGLKKSEASHARNGAELINPTGNIDRETLTKYIPWNIALKILATNLATKN